jgi:hypothetical protein
MLAPRAAGVCSSHRRRLAAPRRRSLLLFPLSSPIPVRGGGTGLHAHRRPRSPRRARQSFCSSVGLEMEEGGRRRATEEERAGEAFAPGLLLPPHRLSSLISVRGGGGPHARRRPNSPRTPVGATKFIAAMTKSP